MDFLGNVRRQKLLSLSLLVFTLSLGIVIGTLVNTGVWAARAQNPAPDAAPLVIPPARPSSNDLAKLVKSIEPAVVNISMDYMAKPVVSKRRGPQPPAGDDDDSEDNMDLFRRFFRGMPDTPQRPYRGGGTGSGFVVDKNGYIITNNHVVEKADHIKVKFPHDQTEYRAKLIGTDEETDIAVIKIEAGRPLQTLKIGNSDGVLVGDAAVAIGSPFGLEASVTSGIISATGRDIGNKQFQHFIQTDAAINPGNSGGPLLNQFGEVIGVNTLIATQSGGYQGIGFALPSNTAVNVYNAIIKSGKVARGSIGIQFQKVAKQQELMRALGLKEGVIVDSVVPGGPSERAGLKSGDVIVAYNGKAIKDGDDLVSHVSETPIGSKATVTIDRNGQRMDKTLTIGDREQQIASATDGGAPAGKQPGEEPSQAESKQQAKFGITLRALTDAERDNSGICRLQGRSRCYASVGRFFR